MFEKEFLTLREIFLARDSKRKQDDEVIKNIWESQRYFTVRLMNIQLSRKDQIKKAHELIKFPWEKESVKERLMTKQEMIDFQMKYIYKV